MTIKRAKWRVLLVAINFLKKTTVGSHPIDSIPNKFALQISILRKPFSEDNYNLSCKVTNAKYKQGVNSEHSFSTVMESKLFVSNQLF